MIDLYEGSVLHAPVDIIIHQANCFNTMGAGIAKEIKRLYPRAYEVDQMTKRGDPKKLGQFTVAIPDEKQDKYIFNLYGQYRYGRDKRYTDYKAVEKGLRNIKEWLKKMEIEDKVIGIPYKMGCKNAGGEWEVVEHLIHEVFGDSNVLICQS